MRIGKRSPISTIGLSLMTFAVCFAQEPTLRLFDVSSDPDFRSYKEVVTAFARKHRPRAENTFCVLGFRTGDNMKAAWVVWQQGNRIILWEGGELDSSRRKIDLKSDVVATEEALHGSTYLVTQAWVADIKSACDRSGVRVQVHRKIRR